MLNFGSMLSKERQERRVDPCYPDRSITYEEMCCGLQAQGSHFSEAGKLARWSRLKKVDNTRKKHEDEEANDRKQQEARLDQKKIEAEERKQKADDLFISWCETKLRTAKKKSAEERHFLAKQKTLREEQKALEAKAYAEAKLREKREAAQREAAQLVSEPKEMEELLQGKAEIAVVLESQPMKPMEKAEIRAQVRTIAVADSRSAQRAEVQGNEGSTPSTTPGDSPENSSREDEFQSRTNKRIQSVQQRAPANSLSMFLGLAGCCRSSNIGEDSVYSKPPAAADYVLGFPFRAQLHVA